MTDDEPDPDEDAFVRDESADGRISAEDGEDRDDDAGNDDDQDRDAEDGAADDARDGAADDAGDAPLGGLADEIRRRREEDASTRPPDEGRPSSGGAGDEAGRTGSPAGATGSPAGDRPGDRIDVTDRDRDPDAPLGGLADSVRQRRAERDAESGDDEFARMEHREIASDQLWESLDDDADGRVAIGETPDGVPGDAAGAGNVGPGGTGTGESGAGEAGATGERDVRVIPKRTCETCPHVADPPTVACTHEGTEILELVGVDRHRVVDCPMVVDDRRFDDETG